MDSLFKFNQWQKSSDRLETYLAVYPCRGAHCREMRIRNKYANVYVSLSHIDLNMDPSFGWHKRWTIALPEFILISRIGLFCQQELSTVYNILNILTT
jgi:hypothetical protein